MPVFAHTYLPKRRHPKTSYLFCITYFHYIFLSVFEKLNSALYLFGVEFTFSNEGMPFTSWNIRQPIDTRQESAYNSTKSYRQKATIGRSRHYPEAQRGKAFGGSFP